jgi:PAS domain S-box-containing protein
MVVYISDFAMDTGLDWTPLGFTLIGILLVAGYLRMHSMAILPIARDTLIETLQDGVLVLDVQKRVIDINPAAQRILGIESLAAIGRDVFTLLAAWKSLPASPESELAAAMQSAGGPTSVVIQLSSSHQVIEVSISPLVSPGQALFGWLFLIRDLTDKRLAFQEFYKLKKLNENIVQNVLEGIALQDVHGDFVFVNPAGANMMGYTTEELLGRNWRLVIAPESHALVDAADQRRRPVDRIAMKPTCSPKPASVCRF